MLRFTSEMLRCALKMLGFYLRFLYKMLRFLVKMLQHLFKIHSFSVEVLALFSENAQNPRENAHIYSFIPSLSSSCSLSLSLSPGGPRSTTTSDFNLFRECHSRLFGTARQSAVDDDVFL